MTFPWYSDVETHATLEQGDIIEKCNIILPSQAHYQAIVEDREVDTPLRILEITAIIVSQSCDITNYKIDSIIVCPVWSLKKLIEVDGYYKSSKGKEELRQGKSPSYHLLNKFETATAPADFYFVDFHNIYSVPKSFLEALILKNPRKRLLPPYREHLSQGFARYFMRVGLPTDIDADEIKNYGAVSS